MPREAAFYFLALQPLTERCLSGRKGRFAKPLYSVKGYRGFESLPLRGEQFIDMSRWLFVFVILKYTVLTHYQLITKNDKFCLGV